MTIIELFLLPEEAANEQEVTRKIFQKEKNFSSYRILKRSIDARSSTVKIRLLVEVFDAGEKIPEQNFSRGYKNVSHSKPVLIIGCGPAGMFAALRLIELGIKPIIIERGKNVRER